MCNYCLKVREMHFLIVFSFMFALISMHFFHGILLHCTVMIYPQAMLP